jgi:hypothetical protein
MKRVNFFIGKVEMKKNCFIMIITLWVSFLSPTTAFAEEWGKLSPYVPQNGIIEGNLMELRSPKQLQEIQDKFQQAMSKNREWFTEYAYNAEPGKPLPYHPNFGITQAEYQKLIELSSQLVLNKVGKVKLKIQKTPQGDLVISCENRKFPLHGLELDNKGTRFKTPYGYLETVSQINQNNEKSPTGTWKGIQWKKEEQLSSSSGIVVKFAIGKLNNKPEGIIYYDVKNIVPENPEQYSVIILYPLKN